jgi:hypothetical protein
MDTLAAEERDALINFLRKVLQERSLMPEDSAIFQVSARDGLRDLVRKLAVPSNELIAHIHDRMPAILEPASYYRWLGFESDPHNLLIIYPSEPMMRVTGVPPRQRSPNRNRTEEEPSPPVRGLFYHAAMHKTA